MGWQDAPVIGDNDLNAVTSTMDADLEGMGQGVPKAAWESAPIVEENRPANPPVSTSENKSLIDRLGDNEANRRQQISELADQYVRGDIGETEFLSRAGLKYAQQLPDAIGSVAAEGFEMLPQSVQNTVTEGISDGINYIGSLSPPGTKATVADFAGVAADRYADFEKEHPVAAGRIGAVLDAGGLVAPFVRVGGKSAINAVEEAVTPAVKGARKVAGKTANAALPNIDEGLVDVAQLAQKHKIPLSFDQVTSSRPIKNIQKVSQEMPFSGQAGFREKQMRAWQRGIFKTFGMEADTFTPSNMKRAFEKVGGEFDSLTKGKQFEVGETLVNDLADLAEEIPSAYGKDAAETFQREALKVMNDFRGDIIPGDVIAFHRARINRLARKATGENALALRDLENAIVDGITSKDPAIEQALSQAKHRYKNLIVVEPLAAKAKGGMISPTQLNTRVARIYKRAHTIGESGEIGELARIGNELLPQLGGSDTAQKAAYIGAAATGAANPATIPVIATGVGVNRAMQTGVNRNQSLIKRKVDQEASRKSKPLRITIRPRLSDRIPK